MTEEEWLMGEDPSKLLHGLRGITGRRMQLLAAAATSRVEGSFSSRHCHLAAEMAYRLADEEVSEMAREDLRRSMNEYLRANAGTRPQSTVNADSAAAKSIHPLPEEAARLSVWAATKSLARQHEGEWGDWEGSLRWAKTRFLPLLRDIFGIPFRPVAFDPAWRTSTDVALAQQMYEARDFSLMPILGDALQDAGCDSADILAHCRRDGPHVRGCWVVDLVLGKS